MVPELKELKAQQAGKDFKVPKAVKDFKDNQETKALLDLGDHKGLRDLRVLLKVHREPLEEALLERKEHKGQQAHKELQDPRAHRMPDSRKT